MQHAYNSQMKNYAYHLIRFSRELCSTCCVEYEGNNTHNSHLHTV